MNIVFDSNISRVLTSIQRKKNKVIGKSKSFQRRNGKEALLRYDKVVQVLNQDMEDQWKGAQYRSGIVIDLNVSKAVRNAMSNEGRNPKGIANGKKRYKYHQLRFYTVLGHTGCIYRYCFMKGKSKRERDEAEREI